MEKAIKALQERLEDIKLAIGIAEERVTSMKGKFSSLSNHIDDLEMERDALALDLADEVRALNKLYEEKTDFVLASVRLRAGHTIDPVKARRELDEILQKWSGSYRVDLITALMDKFIFVRKPTDES